MRQGEEGDNFYVIERGRADVIRDGHSIAALESGAGFGEIASIHDCRHTTSVRATTALTLRALNGPVFVAAVTGYPQSAQVAERVITSHLIGFEPQPNRR